jgi:diguanylate cyclase (GGDEF)-like protein
MFVLSILAEIIAAFFILFAFRKNRAFSLRNLFLAAGAKEELLGVIGDRIQYVQEDNAKLGLLVDTEIALYEVAKELSQSLEESDVLNAFKEKVSTIFGITDCAFIENPSLGKNNNGCGMIKVSRGSRGFLYFTARDFGRINKAKMTTLLAQLELFLKRSQLYREIQELSITDGLTGVYVRRYFLQRLKEELLRAKISGSTLSYILLDVDKFKNINDTYGHIVGDAVLKGIAGILSASLRLIDMCARFGGEEFCLMLPETTKEQALAVSQRIRLKVQEAKIKAFNENLTCTISMGLASYPDDAGQINTLIDKADKALYRAKAQGRNRVCAAGVK